MLLDLNTKQDRDSSFQVGKYEEKTFRQIPGFTWILIFYNVIWLLTILFWLNSAYAIKYAALSDYVRLLRMAVIFQKNRCRDRHKIPYTEKEQRISLVNCLWFALDKGEISHYCGMGTRDPTVSGIAELFSKLPANHASKWNPASWGGFIESKSFFQKWFTGGARVQRETEHSSMLLAVMYKLASDNLADEPKDSISSSRKKGYIVIYGNFIPAFTSGMDQYKRGRIFESSKISKWIIKKSRKGKNRKS